MESTAITAVERRSTSSLSTTTVSAAQERLLTAMTKEGFLFQFPRDLVTTDLLRLALYFGTEQTPVESTTTGKFCKPVEINIVNRPDAAIRSFAVAYGAPSLQYVAESFAQGCSSDDREAIRIRHVSLPHAQQLAMNQGARGLAYFSAPLDDARLVNLSLFDANQVSLGEAELRSLILNQESTLNERTPIRAASLRQPSVRPSATEAKLQSSTAVSCTVLVDSPSSAVRTELLALAPGQIELAGQDCSLTTDPQRAMTSSKAQWGVWIDAEGGMLQAFDRQGSLISAELVLEAISRTLAAGSGNPRDRVVVLERGASGALASRLREAGWRVFRAAASRRAMAAEMRRRGACLGGGATGRIWFGGHFPLADALQAVALISDSAVADSVLATASNRPLSAQAA